MLAFSLKAPFTTAALLLFVAYQSANSGKRNVLGFCPSNIKTTNSIIQQKRKLTTEMVKSCGPRETVPTNNIEDREGEMEENLTKQIAEFKVLLADVMTALSDSELDHLPGLLTRQMSLILSMTGYEGVKILKHFIQEAELLGDEENTELIKLSIEYIMSFAEEFVIQAKSVDDANKNLLGKIIRCIAVNDKVGPGMQCVPVDGGRIPATAERKEAILDQLMEDEKNNFTPGFLRHIEGECLRIQSAPQSTPEASKLLQTMRMIQARVLEELGKDLGEGATVLGQLLGYEDQSERLAVLDAGLTVRGIHFAKELNSLTKEALDGFQRARGVDPTLVQIITEIDHRIESFIDDGNNHNRFQ